jgi:hypothetical protein
MQAGPGAPPWTGQSGPGGPPWAGQWGPGGPPPWAAAPPPAPVRRGGSGKAPWGLWDIVAIVGVTVVTIIVLSLAAIFALEGAGRDLDDLSDPLVLLALSVPQSIGIGLGVWLVLVVRRNLTWKDLGFRRAPLSAYLWMLPLTFVLMIIVGIVGALQNILFDIEPPEGGGLPIDTDDVSGGTMVAIVIIAVILAPFFEELLFRGVLFQYLRSRYLMVARGIFEAVVLSALGFALLHLGGSILPILPLGIILALVMHKWNSLWPPIFLHFLYNSLVVLILFLTI